MNRDATIDALLAEILGGSYDCVELLTDALVNGRVGFTEMSDEELRAACEGWGVEEPKP